MKVRPLANMTEFSSVVNITCPKIHIPTSHHFTLALKTLLRARQIVKMERLGQLSEDSEWTDCALVLCLASA